METPNIRIVDKFSKIGSETEVPTTNFVNSGLREMGLTIITLLKKREEDAQKALEEKEERKRIKQEELEQKLQLKKERLESALKIADSTSDPAKRNSLL